MEGKLAGTDTTAGNRGFLILATSAVFIVTLAGQYSIGRLTDGAIDFFIPESLIAGIALVVFVALPILLTRKHTNSTTGLIVLLPFFVWAIVSAFRGDPAPNVLDGLLQVLALCCLLLVMASLASIDAKFVTKIFLMWTVGSSLLFMAVGLASVAGTAGRVAAFGGGPNVYGRVVGTGALVLVCLVLIKAVPRLLAVMIPALVAATVLSGSRGAMLGVLVAALALLPYLIRNRRVILLVGTLLVGGIVVFQSIGDAIIQMVQFRIVDLTLERGYTSGRDELTGDAWSLFLERPLLGWGLDGFETQLFEASGFSYPHNLFLQVGLELGVLGVLLLVIALLYWFGNRPKNRQDLTGGTLVALVVFYLTVSLFSGDYYDSRYLFLLMVLSVAYARQADPASERKTDQPACGRSRVLRHPSAATNSPSA